jgi:hypothetical protein
MSTPIIGTSAVIKMGATTIGFCKSVSVSIDADLIKEYYIGGTNPDRPAGDSQRKQKLQSQH